MYRRQVCCSKRLAGLTFERLEIYMDGEFIIPTLRALRTQSCWQQYSKPTLSISFATWYYINLKGYSAKFPGVIMNVVSWTQTAAIILGIYYILVYLERALRRSLLLKHTCVLDIDTLGRRLHSQKIKGTAVVCGGR